MTRDGIITLIHELDEETTERRDVFANVESIGRREFFDAAEAGMKAELKAVLWLSDYDGERMAEVGGRLYDVYRTYMRPDEKIELYFADRIGV